MSKTLIFVYIKAKILIFLCLSLFEINVKNE